MPSAVVKFFKYEAERRELTIIFQTRRCYTYKEVPAETYDSMKAAFSKGEFFNEHIRDKFDFVRNADKPLA
jgi:hypothetical protein